MTHMHSIRGTLIYFSFAKKKYLLPPKWCDIIKKKCSYVGIMLQMYKSVKDGCGESLVHDKNYSLKK